MMSYGANCGEQYRRSAEYVDKVLKGAKPDDPPIEQGTKFELVVNLKLPQHSALRFPIRFCCVQTR